MKGMEALRTAAPYLSRFRGKIFVIKLGGEVLDAPDALEHVLEQFAILHHLGIRLIVVHGGGVLVDQVAEQMHVRTVKIAGRRVTSPEALDLVKMAIGGKARIDLCAAMRKYGLMPIGLTGVDGGLIQANRRPPIEVEVEGQQKSVDFGLVGDITTINTPLLMSFLDQGLIPVISSLTGSPEGDVFNTNADTIASAISTAVAAEKLFFVLSVPGLLKDPSQQNSIIPFLTLDELTSIGDAAKVSGGMLPKLAAVQKSLEGGVGAVHLIGGKVQDAILIEVFTNEGSGTMIRIGPA
ncbi:MAG: acetylglutamate kinase [Armatimonadetes bacterium]|nr:acetylglutamate kinase [Armatimonadota bacterium]